jgi:hypothetical protein
MTNSNSGYDLKLTSIGSNTWQLFLTKTNESSDYVRIVYGVTEQVGGGARSFETLRSYIIVPNETGEQVFMLAVEEHMMKNRRVWAAFETVKRNKGKRGISVGTYIALSPMQSKWRTTIGSATSLDIKPVALNQFTLLYKQDKSLTHERSQLIDGL